MKVFLSIVLTLVAVGHSATAFQFSVDMELIEEFVNECKGQEMVEMEKTRMAESKAKCAGSENPDLDVNAFLAPLDIISKALKAGKGRGGSRWEGSDEDSDSIDFNLSFSSPDWAMGKLFKIVSALKGRGGPPSWEKGPRSHGRGQGSSNGGWQGGSSSSEEMGGGPMGMPSEFDVQQRDPRRSEQLFGSILKMLKRNKREIDQDLDGFMQQLKDELTATAMKQSNYTCMVQELQEYDADLNFDYEGMEREIGSYPFRDPWVKEKAILVAKTCAASVEAMPEEFFKGALNKAYKKGHRFRHCKLEEMKRVCFDYSLRNRLERLFGPIAPLAESAGIDEAALLEVANDIRSNF